MNEMSKYCWINIMCTKTVFHNTSSSKMFEKCDLFIHDTVMLYLM